MPGPCLRLDIPGDESDESDVADDWDGPSWEAESPPPSWETLHFPFLQVLHFLVQTPLTQDVEQDLPLEFIMLSTSD